MEEIKESQCLIDSHVPTDDGENCDCGYFTKNQVMDDINKKDGIYT